MLNFRDFSLAGDAPPPANDHYPLQGQYKPQLDALWTKAFCLFPNQFEFNLSPLKRQLEYLRQLIHESASENDPLLIQRALNSTAAQIEQLYQKQIAARRAQLTDVLAITPGSVLA